MLLFLCLGLYCLLSSRQQWNSSSHASEESSVPPWTRGGFRGVGEEAETYTNLPLTPSLCKEGERSIGWASLFLGLACLTRYEAWVITAAAGLYYARTRSDGRSLTSHLQLVTKTMALFGWAPLLWILLHRGVSPQGTYVLEGPATWERLLRIPYIIAMALYHAGPIVGGLALLGLVTFWKRSLWAKPGIQMVILAAALLVVSLVFSAHGVEPNPQRYVTDREAHWLVLFAFWAAALGLHGLKEPSGVLGQNIALQNTDPLVESCVPSFIGLFWSWRWCGACFKQTGTSNGCWLTRISTSTTPWHNTWNKIYRTGDVALVFAQPLPANSAQQYLDKVYSQGGTEALEVARQQLAELNSGAAGLFAYRCKYPRSKRPDRGWKQADRERFRHAELCLAESRALGSSLLQLPGSGGQHEPSVGLFETAKRATSYPQGSRLAGVHLRGTVLNRCLCSSVLSEMK